jgi:hypothetical protein
MLKVSKLILKVSKLTLNVSKLNLKVSKLTLKVSKLNSLLHDNRTPVSQFISIMLSESVSTHRGVIFLVPFFNNIIAKDQLSPALKFRLFVAIPCLGKPANYGRFSV